MYTTAQLSTLKTELQLPAYTGKSHVDIAVALNQPDRPVDRDTLDPGLLVASIVPAEFAALTAGEKQYVQLIAGSAGVLPLTATIKTGLGAAFPAGSATRTNLLGLLKRTGSRVEELGLPRVTESDVANALRQGE